MTMIWRNAAQAAERRFGSRGQTFTGCPQRPGSPPAMIRFLASVAIRGRLYPIVDPGERRMRWQQGARDA